MAPTAGIQLGSAKNKKYMALAIRGSNFVLLGRFEESMGKYGLSPLTIWQQFEAYIQSPGGWGAEIF